MLQITQGYVIVDTVDSVVIYKTFRSNRTDSWLALCPPDEKSGYQRFGYKCVPMEGRLTYQVFKKQQ